MRNAPGHWDATRACGSGGVHVGAVCADDWVPRVCMLFVGK
jgi:hypothetical protein